MTQSAGPSVTWAGVIIRLSDGTIVATEFPSGFITADVHTLKPWQPGSRNQVQDEVRITVQGNGRIWTEGADMVRHPAAELEGRREIGA